MQGWIRDYRKELISDIWMMPPLYHRVWQYLKYKVNHRDATLPTKTGPITVRKGQTVTSMRQIAEGVKWTEYGVERIPSPKTIRGILDVLQALEMITRESNAKGTVITVLNYCAYQGETEGESNAEETQRKRTGPTNKNVKNEKNDITPPLAPPKPKPQKIKYADHVKMTEGEYQALANKFGEQAARSMIEILDNYKGSKGKTYKDDYRAILSWVVKRYKEDERRSSAGRVPKAWETIQGWGND